MRRGIQGVLAALLLYGNATVALQPPLVRRAGLAWPTPIAVYDAFLMSGMFTSFSRYNADPFVDGQDARGQWVRLPLREFFPERQGVAFTRLFAMHHWDMHGPSAQRQAFVALAPKLRARHNRLRPDQPVTRVRFGVVEWPQSTSGFRAQKQPELMRTRVMYLEPRP